MMRLRPTTYYTLIGITLISISVISFILQSASAQSAPGFSFPGMTAAPSVRSQLWINNGTWWGIFSDGSSGTYFYQKVGNDFVKGSLVDANVLAMPDTLWDGTNLYALVQGEDEVQAKVYKYSYSEVTGQYDLSPGFPVTLPLSGLPDSAVIAKDSNEKLWVAYAGGESEKGGDSSIHVIWSTSADHLTWDTAGLVLETGTASDATEVAAIVAFNDGAPKIGVFWSNQALGEYAFKYHSDVDLETVWSAKEIVDSNGSVGPAGIAGEYASIQAAPDGRVLAVGNDEIGLGHVHLYVRSTSGIWSARLPVTPPSSKPSRPILLLDTDNNSIYCLYRDSTFNKAIYYARANLTDPTSFDAPGVLISTKADDPTSTKQHLNSSTDLVAAASKDGTVFWNFLDLSTPPSASFLADPTSGDAPLSVNFTDTSTDQEGIVGHSWNFGDGYTSTEPNPTHVFRAGTWNVTLQVTNAGGGTAISASQSIVVADVGNPVIQAISPAVVNTNTITGDFTLTVDGAAFVDGAVVRFNGSDLSTTFVSDTRLTTTIILADVATVGDFPITVALPSSAVSNSLNLTVTGDPTLFSISPEFMNAGDPDFTLTVDGMNFTSASLIRINGNYRATTFVSSTQLTAQITASDIAAGGFYPITVVVPGGLDSNAVMLSVQNLAPTLTSISPTNLPAGNPAFELTAFGTNFNSGTLVRFNGLDRAVALVSSTEVRAQIAASEILGAGVFSVEIFNPAPGGGVSSALSFTAESPAPTLTAVTPTTATAGATAFTLTADGANFNPSSLVQWNGVNRATSFVNSTRLTAQITSEDLQTGGIFPVTVSNPAGTISSPVNFTVNNPSPQLATITPANVIAAGRSFTLTINGTGFVPGSVVRFNGNLPANERTTVLVSSTQLTATVNAADIATPGTFPITVFCPTPGGGLSNAVSLPVSNPTPTMTAISPTSVTAGAATFALTVNGSHFNNTSVVRINGVDRATAFVNHTQLNIQIAAAEVATTGTISVEVFNPTPGGGLTSPVQLTVNNPQPAVVTISPNSRMAGAAAFTLTVNGTDFIASSVVRFNNSNRVTTYVSGTQLQTQITEADISTAGTADISVFNPAPGGGTSAATTFTINNAMPTIGGISPASAAAGGAAFTLTVNGAGFVSGTVVRFNNTDRSTTVVSSTQLTIQIAASDIAAAGIANISVFTPAPGGGASSAVDLQINNPAPTLTSISPNSKAVGNQAFLLLVNGLNFNSSSVVRFNGTARPTTFVSASQLSAQMSPADVSSAGHYPIVVFTPSPGGGTSSATNLSVNNPSPTIANLAPTSFLQGSSACQLTVNGTGFSNSSLIMWNGQNRPTTFISSTQLKAQITADDLNAGAAVSITVNNPEPGGGTSNSSVLSITTNPRLLKVSNASGSPGSSASLTIQLLAQGDENALGFALVYDPSLLSNPTASLAADAAGATLNVNVSQVAQGRYGVALSLPAGTSFAAGTKNLVVVTFTVANVGSQTQTPIDFGDQPVGREVANATAETLATVFTPGSLAISPGVEADVAKRPDGSYSGTVSIADWVQLGRFVAGIDTIAPGIEFQKADCAPRSTLGNGLVTVADWVQAGRYASGLDPQSSSGGPSAPSTGTPLSLKDFYMTNSVEEEGNISRAVRLTNAVQPVEDERIVTIELDAQGIENALGFSLMFDSEKFRFNSADSGTDAQFATLQVNRASASEGRIGIAIALPGGQSFHPGTNQVVTLRFARLRSSSEQIAVTFTDLPITRELVAVDASNLKASFEGPPAGINPIDDAQYFVYQHYLDILGRSPDSQGLDYWTNQITFCGADQLCAQRKRVDVSNAFFFEREFQQTGAYVHRIYQSALGTSPTYDQFVSDRGRVVGNAQELDRSKSEFTNSFVQRPDFKLLYPLTMTAERYVEALSANTGYSLTEAQRNELATGLANGTETRSTVLRKIAEDPAVVDREYNRSFVLTQYFGYLRRDPDNDGFDFWLGHLNRFPLRDVEIQQAMVCAFITSPEYQLRFGAVVKPYGCGR